MALAGACAAGDAGARVHAEARGELAIAEEPPQGSGECARIPRRHQQAVVPVAHGIGDAADARRTTGQPAAIAFEQAHGRALECEGSANTVARARMPAARLRRAPAANQHAIADAKLLRPARHASRSPSPRELEVRIGMRRRERCDGIEQLEDPLPSKDVR
jgi:hypothetical protein